MEKMKNSFSITANYFRIAVYSHECVQVENCLQWAAIILCIGKTLALNKLFFTACKKICYIHTQEKVQRKTNKINAFVIPKGHL